MLGMVDINKLQKRNLVSELHSKHMQHFKLFTVNYFTGLGFKRRTIYRVIQKIEDVKSLLRKKKYQRLIQMCSNKEVI